MKKIVLSLSLFAMLLAAAHANLSSQAGATSASKAYACPKCHVASAKARKCACGETMIGVEGRVAYVCAKCNKSSAKPAKCAACGGKMQKSLITYACEDCKVSSAKPGECKMCKGRLHKYVLPFQ